VQPYHHRRPRQTPSIRARRPLSKLIFSPIIIIIIIINILNIINRLITVNLRPTYIRSINGNMRPWLIIMRQLLSVHCPAWSSACIITA
jgi:hypothetical protein